MKNVKTLIAGSFMFLVGALMAMSLNVSAQTYPVTTPVYVPNAVKASSVLTAPGDYTFVNSGVGTVAFDFHGTCTALNGYIQGSVDGTNYVQLNVFPVTYGTITATSSVAATGTYRVDTAGFQKVRAHIIGLSASCTITAVGTPAAFQGTY